MRAIRVQYIVKPNFAEHNKANVRAVMDDLRKNPIPGMRYSTWYLGDGKFMHLNVSRDETANGQLNERESYKQFRVELKASEPVSPPKSEDLEMVGANFDEF
jgi:hypothetical protein